MSLPTSSRINLARHTGDDHLMNLELLDIFTFLFSEMGAVLPKTVWCSAQVLPVGKREG